MPPLIATAATTLATIGSATGITAVTGLTVTAASLTSALGSLLASVAVGALKSVLFKPDTPRQQEPPGIKTNTVEALPPVRYCYGTREVGGTVTAREVVGGWLYIGYLLNSRPSKGPFTLRIDGREIQSTGDPYDFSGPGAQPVANGGPADILVDSSEGEQYLRWWIGLGSHTGYPATIQTAWPGVTAAPDWQGFTVLWCAYYVGPNSERARRWPKGQPQATLEGPWSLVYDPRTLTTDYSDTAALVTLDILRSDLGIAAPDTKIDMDNFGAGATIDEQQIPLKAGGTEKRYTAHGVWVIDPDQEPHGTVGPSLQAAMATIVEVEGKWRYIPGVYQAPDVFMTDADIVGDEMTLDLVSDPAERGNGARVRFVSPDRGYEWTSFDGDYQDAAALAEDGGEPSWLTDSLEWVTSKGQAARIRKRMVQIARAQKRLTTEWRYTGLAAHVGANVSVSAPTLPAMAGEYVCANWAVNFRPVDAEAGIYKVRVPMLLRESRPDFDDWDASEEPDIIGAPANTQQSAPQPPTLLSVIQTSDGDVLTAHVTAEPSTSVGITHYRMRWRKVGATDYDDIVTVGGDDRNSMGRVELRAIGLNVTDYEFEMQAVSVLGESTWATVTEATSATAPPATAAPVITSLVNSGSGINVNVTAPNDPVTRRVCVYRNTVDDFATATKLGTILATANEAVTYHDTPFPPDDLYFYWATTLNNWNVESPESASESILINEGA